MSRRLVVWRHGRTEWNARGLMQGQTDVPLDEVGRAQAAAAAPRLAALGPARVVSSDLDRARSTARALADLTGLEVTTDHRLREAAYGIREGRTREQAVAEYPAEMAVWAAGDDVRLPGAETYAEVAERFGAALRDLLADAEDGSTTVVVAHGGAMRVGLLDFVGVPRAAWDSFGGFDNCAWAVLDDRAGRWRVREWNASVADPA